MILSTSYKVLRLITPVAPDTDWVALQAVPPEVELADGEACAQVEVKVSARSETMVPIKGTCDVEIVSVGDDGVVSSVASQTLAYLMPMMATAGTLLAVRITGATGAPGRLTIVAKGIP